MGIFKKSNSSPVEEKDDQDMDFLKQNIKTDNSAASKPSLPKLTDILENKTDAINDLKDNNLKPQTVEQTKDSPETKPKESKPIPQATPVTTTPAQPTSATTPVKNPASKTLFKPTSETSASNTSDTSALNTSETLASNGPDKKLDIDTEALKDLKSQIEDQKKLIEEQKKKIESLESVVKGIESREQLINENHETLTKLTERLDAIESLQSPRDDEPVSDEERALIKAGKFLEKRMEDVNHTYEKLDNKIQEMRTFMADVDEKERKFIDLEDQLIKLQRRTESTIETDLLAKSHEAVKTLEENKSRIQEETEELLKNLEAQIQDFKTDIESTKQRAIDSIDQTIENLKNTEREVRKTIDEKMEYDSEHMRRTEEVITIMNEAVKKILGNGPASPEPPD